MPEVANTRYALHRAVSQTLTLLLIWTRTSEDTSILFWSETVNEFFWFANENDLRISLFGSQIDCSSEYGHALTVSVDNVASMKIINSPGCLCELIMMMSF